MEREVTMEELVKLIKDKEGDFIRACQLKCVSFLFPLVFEGCSVDCTD